MPPLDVVAYAGERHGGVKPANFLDIGGGASAEVMAAGLDVILGDEQVKSVFVNVVGGINGGEARRILAEPNHPLVTEVGTMDEAADVAAAKAAEAAHA